MAGPGPAPRTQNPVVATTPVVARPAVQLKAVRPHRSAVRPGPTEDTPHVPAHQGFGLGVTQVSGGVLQEIATGGGWGVLGRSVGGQPARVSRELVRTLFHHRASRCLRGH